MPMTANAPLFNSNNYSHSYSWIEKTIGHAIDFYSIQMDHPGAYSTCERLLHQSHGQYKQTSLFQVSCATFLIVLSQNLLKQWNQLHDIWGVPLSKIVIGRVSRQPMSKKGAPLISMSSPSTARRD